MSQAAPIFQRREEPTLLRLAAGFALALTAHGLLVGLVALLAEAGMLEAPPRPKVKTEPVALMNMTASQWEANRKLVKQPALPEKRREREALPKGQVVDVEAGNDQKPDDSAKYLAEHNNRVDKETRAREQTSHYERAMPKLTVPKPDAPVRVADNKVVPAKKGNDGNGSDEAARHLASALNQAQAGEKQRLLLAQRDPHGDLRDQSETPERKGDTEAQQAHAGESEAKNSEGSAGTPTPNLVPSAAALAQMAGAAPNDALENVEAGDGTFLNTREFKYAPFFNRVKQRVTENWNPEALLRKLEAQHKVDARQKRVTVLHVTLDSEGLVKNVTVARSCGVDELDAETVAAFERAQPFINPPAGLLDADGELQFGFSFLIDNDQGAVPGTFRFHN